MNFSPDRGQQGTESSLPNEKHWHVFDFKDIGISYYILNRTVEHPRSEGTSEVIWSNLSWESEPRWDYLTLHPVAP